MRCYRVLVHGKLNWLASRRPDDAPIDSELAGFYCHRYVLAADEAGAAETAFRRVRRNLDEQGWTQGGAVTVELSAEDVSVAPFHKLLRPDTRGYTFY